MRCCGPRRGRVLCLSRDSEDERYVFPDYGCPALTCFNAQHKLVALAAKHTRERAASFERRLVVEVEFKVGVTSTFIDIQFPKLRVELMNGNQ